MNIKIINQFIKEFWTNDVGIEQVFECVLIKTISGYKNIKDLTTHDLLITGEETIKIKSISHSDIAYDKLILYNDLVYPFDSKEINDKEKILYNNSLYYTTEMELDYCKNLTLKILNKEYDVLIP